MTIKAIAATIAALSLSLGATAQVQLEDFKPVSDSLQVLLKERTTVQTYLSLKNVTRRGKTLDYYFTTNLGDVSWQPEDVEWLRTTLGDLMPENCSGYSVGKIFCNRHTIEDLITPELMNDGQPQATEFKVKDRKGKYNPIVSEIGAMDFNKGLSDRHIALWQSHGRYYETAYKRWEWQRAQDFTTVEDTYTQSYVLPFLIPMLENAGAYVMTPRERDTQSYEVITDNDPAFEGERRGHTRRLGKYSENGKWEDAGLGFADAKMMYTGHDNPFTMGTVRQAPVIGSKGRKAEIRWTPDVPERGEYAVYVSYKTLENSTEAAHYTVHHLGGETEFAVNQKMGGSSWVYLGTFEFGEGTDGYVTLANDTPKGAKFVKNTVVTADAVRLGGGMGKIGRGEDDDDPATYTTSGMPAYLEGALYSMQWNGVDTSVTAQYSKDYTNDYASRGPWVNYMAGGSFMNPKAEGKGIPFDISFAWHTDAGTTPNDSIIGCLSIYTLEKDGSQKFANGDDRMTNRELTDLMQTQICDDIRVDYDSKWTRRYLWNRNYSESRTPEVPSSMLELLSHQNFGDMKLGLDPSFRFTVSRAVYKGMLKYLSNRFGFEYAVQPLPVNSFAVTPIDATTAKLSWKNTVDALEPTANPTGYIVYTRVDDGAFDTGVNIGSLNAAEGVVSTEVTIEPGHLYSFKIVAYNEGGLSFPSEVLCVGTPKNAAKQKVMIVNNFNRVAPPAWFDTPTYAGFDTRLDGGVGYHDEITYIGEQYQFRRELPWLDDDNPGFGASYTDYAGKRNPGNTFDFVVMHARAIMEAGYPVYSASAAAFAAEPSIADAAWAADILCGKQVTTAVGRGEKADKYQVFPVALQRALRKYTRDGGNVLISGANIGTDVWDRIYPTVQHDSTYAADTKQFVTDVLGYKWVTNYASPKAELYSMKNELLPEFFIRPFSFHNKKNETIYCVETPDGILPASDKAETFLRYSDTHISAGVCFEGDGYKTVSLGFPIEVVKEKDAVKALFNTAFEFFKK